ncbi:MAG: alpha/beta hydrolase [Mycobacterium sp.]
MALAPDAAKLVEAMNAHGYTGFAKIGLEGARQMVDNTAPPGFGPKLHSVEDARCPIGDVPVRIYRPAAGSLPVVVFFHGGGWALGSLKSHDSVCRRVAADTGAAVVAVDYRLAPEHPFPAAIDDAWAATRWVFDRISEWGLDHSQLAVAGDSAGGNLAAVVARLCRDHGVELRQQILIYPIIDRRLDRPSMIDNAAGFVLERADMEWFWNLYDPKGIARCDARAVPLAVSDLSGLAPCVVITAEHDPLRDEGEEYGAKLADAGVPTTVRRFDGMFHGFVSMLDLLPAADEAIAVACNSLKTAFN